MSHAFYGTPRAARHRLRTTEVLSKMLVTNNLGIFYFYIHKCKKLNNYIIHTVFFIYWFHFYKYIYITLLEEDTFTTVSLWEVYKYTFMHPIFLLTGTVSNNAQGAYESYFWATIFLNSNLRFSYLRKIAEILILNIIRK